MVLSDQTASLYPAGATVARLPVKEMVPGSNPGLGAMIWIDVKDMHSHMRTWTRLRIYLEWRFGPWNEEWRYLDLTEEVKLRNEG